MSENTVRNTRSKIIAIVAYVAIIVFIIGWSVFVVSLIVTRLFGNCVADTNKAMPTWMRVTLKVMCHSKKDFSDVGNTERYHNLTEYAYGDYDYDNETLYL